MGFAGAPEPNLADLGTPPNHVQPASEDLI